MVAVEKRSHHNSPQSWWYINTCVTHPIVHDMPCNSSFEDQEIGLGQCPPVFSLSLPFSNPIDFPLFHGNQQLTIPGFNYMITLLMFYPFCPSTIKLYRILMTLIPNWVEKSPSSFVTFITTSPSYNQWRQQLLMMPLNIWPCLYLFFLPSFSLPCFNYMYFVVVSVNTPASPPLAVVMSVGNEPVTLPNCSFPRQ